VLGETNKVQVEEVARPGEFEPDPLFRRVVNKALVDLGKIDVVVNNAGCGLLARPRR
jgi:NAD(P)-dependent dehydrogenase (short-subunit alcohol dehydrogenase family)